MIDARFFVDLLRRHVEGGAHVCVREERLLAQHARKAKVTQFHGAVAVDEDVSGLDVTVQDLLGARVAVVQRQQQLERDVPHVLLLKTRAAFAVPADLVPQIAALAELHYNPNLGCLLVDNPAKHGVMTRAKAAAVAGGACG